jgi:hypothetical protein
MSLSLTKSTWSSLEKLFASQLNAITVQLLRAMDGTGGGTYNPSSVLSIGGQGIGMLLSRLNVSSATLWEFVSPIAAVETVMSTTGWLVDGATISIFDPLGGTPIPPNANAYFPIRLQDGVTITGAKVEIGRSAGTPTTEGTLSVISYNSALSPTVHGSAAVAAGTGQATATVSGLSASYSLGSGLWFLRVAGEVGGGAADITAFYPRVVHTTIGLSLLRG